METLTKPTDTRLRRFTETGTVYPILFMISITHLLNDMMQSVIPAVYPLLKEKFGFTFAQIGIITLVFQMTSSLLQPFIGLYADRHPRPYSLAAGMCFTLLGLFTLSVAPGFVPILQSARDWIVYFTIFEIKALLRESAMDLKTIVARVNFPDQSTLSRFFRRYTGMSPSRYRKNIHF